MADFDPVSYIMGAKAGSGGGGGGGGSSTLSGLTDVDITNPTDGQTLVYNASTEKWENGEGSQGEGGQIVIDLDSATKSVTIEDDEYNEIKVVISDFEAYSGSFIIVPASYFNRISNIALKYSRPLLPFPNPEYCYESITYASVAHGYPMLDQAGGSEPKLTIAAETTVGYISNNDHEYVLIPDTANFKTYLVIPGG